MRHSEIACCSSPALWKRCAGCVNVSPADAESLFGWSDPPVPEEWQGATGAGAPENGRVTAIVVRR